MKYGIWSRNGKLIALFKYEEDRDACIRMLREKYPDTKFLKYE